MKPPVKPAPGKRPYRTPRLVVHGDLTALTLVKAGRANDGAAKPRTKLLGPGA